MPLWRHKALAWPWRKGEGGLSRRRLARGKNRGVGWEGPKLAILAAPPGAPFLLHGQGGSAGTVTASKHAGLGRAGAGDHGRVTSGPQTAHGGPPQRGPRGRTRSHEDALAPDGPSRPQSPAPQACRAECKLDSRPRLPLSPGSLQTPG